MNARSPSSASWRRKFNSSILAAILANGRRFD
jgi:hypothetical protein